VSTTANLAARLIETVGSQHVVCAQEELVSYAVDGLSPALIVRPVSAAEVLEVVKFAIAEKLKILPVGSRSKCEIGAAPARFDIALDITGLHEIAHYDAGDMTLSIDAGTPLRQVEEFLRPHRQFLPLAVPCFESTTAGGAVASGIDSVLRQQYGPARDFLIGAEFVDGKGQLCKSGGRVVKNVTGYDLHKLLIGSLGTLGVITRLNFRTFPVPAVTRGFAAAFAKGTAALEFRNFVEKAGVPLTNFELISPEAGKMMRAILQEAGEPVAEALQEGTWCAYASFEGTESVVKRIAGELDKFARGAGSRNLAVLEGAADDALSGMLREAFEWLRWAAMGTLVYRLAVCDELPAVIAELEHAAMEWELRSAPLLRSAGILYFALLADSETEIAARAAAIDGRVSFVAQSSGGQATLLHGPLQAKLKIVETRGARADAKLQERVKLSFDPGRMFVPGRIVGAI
jgi:FAD/FMN-containing dehydrogenase